MSHLVLFIFLNGSSILWPLSSKQNAHQVIFFIVLRREYYVELYANRRMAKTFIVALYLRIMLKARVQKLYFHHFFFFDKKPLMYS